MSGGNRSDSMAGQVAMAAPSVTAVLTSWERVTVQDWLAISGIIFIGLQAVYLIWRWVRDARRESDRRRDRAASRNLHDDAQDTET